MFDRCAQFSRLGRLCKPGARTLLFAAWVVLASTGRAETASTAAAPDAMAQAKPASNDAAAADTHEGTEAAKSKPPAVDPALPSYQPAKGITGRLKSVGSDTMNNLLALWSEDFRKIYPGVRDRNRRQGVGHGSAGADSGDGRFWPDEPRHEPGRNRPIHVGIRLSADAIARGDRHVGGLRPSRTIRWKA